MAGGITRGFNVDDEWRIYAWVNSTTFGLYNVSSPVLRQAIISTNAGLVSIRSPGTIFSEILNKIQ